MAEEKSILFSAEESDRINARVQEEIAPHLFLVCNYAPNRYPVQSEDARFVVGMLNLYKFVKDASIVDKIIYMDWEQQDHLNDSFKDNIKTVSALRQIYCHNESEISGNDADIRTVDDWMQMPASTEDHTEDYKELNRKLQGLADEIIAEIDQFIGNVANSDHKDEVIAAWENEIGQFYKRPNTGKILIGRLEKYYASKKGITQQMSKPDISNMQKCIRAYYLRNLEEEKRENEQALKDATELTNAGTLSLSEEDLQKLQPLAEAAGEAVAAKKKEIVEFLHYKGLTIDNIDQKMYCYKDFYIRKLPERIISFMKEREPSDYKTLLPQDIVPTVLREDLGAYM
jgi:hypothetical protein